MKLLQLYAELRRRRVIRVTSVYLIVAWAVIQVSTTVFPVLELPAWTTKLVVVLALLGIPITIFLAWAYDLTVEGITPDLGVPTIPGGVMRRMLQICVVIVLVGAGAAWLTVTQRARRLAENLDPTLVAVLPFRIAGADPALHYLREGMVDLLGLKLTGDQRTVDARTTLAAFRSVVGDDVDPPLTVARILAMRLRARSMVLGSVVGSAQSMTVSAALIDVPTGLQIAAAADTGRADQVHDVIDRVVAKLLSAQAGEPEDQLAALTSTSLPALRAYLEGNVHYRRGRYTDALDRYMYALELDSTFVLAALNVPDAAGMILGVANNPAGRARHLIGLYRDRLNATDRAYVDARWPAEGSSTSIQQSIERLELAAQQVPDRPEVWYHLGDLLFHNGAVAGVEDNMERARAAFERAIALDSSYFVPLQHLVWIADQRGDSAYVLRVAEDYLTRNPNDGVSARDFRVRVARWRGDTAALQSLRADLETAPTDVLIAIALLSQVEPHSTDALDVGRKAAKVLLGRAVRTDERNAALRTRYEIELNAGRPAAALAALARITPPVDDRTAIDRRHMYNALYWDGDTTVANAAAQRVTQHLRGVAPGRMSDSDANALCALTSWRLTRGDTNAALDAIERLRLADASGSVPLGRQICAAALHAVLGETTSAPDAHARLIALDSLLRTGPSSALREQGNIVAARLFEAHGDAARGLAAARRILFNNGGQMYRSTFLELQGRLAAAAGDRDTAIRAYSQYLNLRAEPEPGLVARVNGVMQELAALTSDRR